MSKTTKKNKVNSVQNETIHGRAPGGAWQEVSLPWEMLTVVRLNLFTNALSTALFDAFRLKIKPARAAKMRDMVAESLGFVQGGYQQAVTMLPPSRSDLEYTNLMFGELTLGQLMRLAERINDGLGKYFDIKVSVKKMPKLLDAVSVALGFTEGGYAQAQRLLGAPDAGSVASGQQDVLWALREGDAVIAAFRANLWQFDANISKNVLLALDSLRALSMGQSQQLGEGAHSLTVTSDVDAVFTHWVKQGASALHVSPVYCLGIEVGIAKSRAVAIHLSGVIESVLAVLRRKDSAALNIRRKYDQPLLCASLWLNKARDGLLLPCSQVVYRDDKVQLMHPEYGVITVCRSENGWLIGEGGLRFDSVNASLYAGTVMSVNCGGRWIKQSFSDAAHVADGVVLLTLTPELPPMKLCFDKAGSGEFSANDEVTLVACRHAAS